MIRELSWEEEWASVSLLGIVPATVHRMTFQDQSCKMEWSLESDTKVHFFFFMTRVLLWLEKVCKSLSNLGRGFSLSSLEGCIFRFVGYHSWQFWAKQGYNAR